MKLIYTHGTLDASLAETRKAIRDGTARAVVCGAAKQHQWDDGKRFGYPVCRACGIVKRRDGNNSPRKGPVKVSVR